MPVQQNLTVSEELHSTSVELGIMAEPHCGGKNEMVQVRGETSNRLFQVLEEWNTILQGSSLYLNPPLVGS